MKLITDSLKFESLLIRHFPDLRHLKHKMAADKIRRNWKTIYGKKISRIIDICRGSHSIPKLQDKPSGYAIELTNMCNLHCPMCSPQLSKRKKMHMDIKVYEKLMNRIKDEGIKSVSLHTVGETFVYPRLKEAVAIAKKLGIEVLISTNANEPEKLLSLYESDPGWVKGFRFSVDSAVPKTYNKVRAGGKLEKVMESCEWILKVNKKRHMSRIALSFACVISQDNIREIATFFRVFSKYTFPERIRFGLLNGLSPNTVYFRENKLSLSNLYALQIPCPSVFGAVFFNNEGCATLCCRDYDNQLVIGSATEQPISQVWHSEKASQIRKQHLDKNVSASQCLNCYTPKPGVNGILNDYIHFLYYAEPRFDDEKWREKITNFLNELDSTAAKDSPGTDITAIEEYSLTL